MIIIRVMEDGMQIGTSGHAATTPTDTTCASNHVVLVNALPVPSVRRPAPRALTTARRATLETTAQKPRRRTCRARRASTARRRPRKWRAQTGWCARPGRRRRFVRAACIAQMFTNAVGASRICAYLKPTNPEHGTACNLQGKYYLDARNYGNVTRFIFS